MLHITYSKATHPELYRGERMTSKAFTEELRKLDHREEGLFFLGAHRDGSQYAEQLASVQQTRKNLWEARDASR